jgi:two-component system nitrate/nitrite response regulator NarL
MPEAIRILLIDDHSLFREAIARLLSAQPDFHIAGQAATVEEGIRTLKETGVDIVLLDINLGFQQGGAFLGLAREEGFTGKILVVTAGVSQMEAVRLMRRGCSGIILKNQPPEQLISSIREAIARKFDDGPPKEQMEQLRAHESAVPKPLTPRESQVLRRVFAGLSNKEIASRLAVSEALVKSVVQQLFTKAGVRTRSQLVLVAVERYWKELEEESLEES